MGLPYTACFNGWIWLEPSAVALLAQQKKNTHPSWRLEASPRLSVAILHQVGSLVPWRQDSEANVTWVTSRPAWEFQTIKM